MFRALSHAMLVVGLVVFASGAVIGQDKKKSPPEYDELAEKAFEKRDELEYHLGKEGLKKISFLAGMEFPFSSTE